MPTYAPERGQQGGTLLSTIANGTTISNSTAEAISVPDYVFPAGFFQQGTTVRGVVRGVCSNVVTTPGTLIHRVRIGAATLSATAVVATAALGLDTTARTDFAWELRFEAVCRSVGASGSAVISGTVLQENVLASTAANLLPNLMPASANAAQTLNTTIANFLSISAQFSVATSPTNLTANQYILEQLV